MVLLTVVPLSLVVAGPRAKKKAPADPETWAQQASERLMGAALQSPRGWKLLEELCDTIGARLSGSVELEQAVTWGGEKLAALPGVRVEEQEVMVPHWIRGQESLFLTTPPQRELAMLGLGMSVGTAEEGVEAALVVVSSFDELDALGRAGVEGKIVLYDVPFTTYGATVQYRVRGPDAAARLGAVAALVRSVTPSSLNTPHTGTTRYIDGDGRIPAAAITVEDSETLHRLVDRGEEVRLRLTMEARQEEDARSANVIAELKGRELPDEVVLVSCHLDSWDVGQGAQDDGAGCVMAMETIRLISELDYRPRRSVRAVLYTNEENGVVGGATYAQERKQPHVAVIEADVGCGPARGWRLDLAADDREVSEAEFRAAEARMAPIQEALQGLKADGLRRGFAGADIKDLVRQGSLGLGLDMDTSGYWPIHHTDADTLDKIDPIVLRRNTAVMAVTAFLLAEAEPPQTR